jgi:alpha-N-acetylglucosaminidase
MVDFFGTDHFYSADPFNELYPGADTEEYFAQVGKAIFAPMRLIDPNAKWVIQGWFMNNFPPFWSEGRVSLIIEILLYR